MAKTWGIKKKWNYFLLSVFFFSFQNWLMALNYSNSFLILISKLKSLNKKFLYLMQQQQQKLLLPVKMIYLSVLIYLFSKGVLFKIHIR